MPLRRNAAESEKRPLQHISFRRDQLFTQMTSCGRSKDRHRRSDAAIQWRSMAALMPANLSGTGSPVGPFAGNPLGASVGIRRLHQPGDEIEVLRNVVQQHMDSVAEACQSIFDGF